MSFERYLNKFGRLRTGVSKGKGKAPHKPVLLLAIIDLIDQGEITQNRIYISPELVAAFRKLWTALVKETSWQPRFYLPFYHLVNERFWHLHVLPGAEIALTTSHSVKSLTALRATVEYAYLDNELFDFLLVESYRNQFKNRLLKVYFPDIHYEVDSIISQVKQYISQLEFQMIEERSNRYLEPYELEDDEEDQAVRSGLFKRKIPEYYNYTCCISGLRIDAITDISIIDACHIVPWSESKDDSVKNGFALCPNLHRAFDRGLIGIDKEYKVIVSESFIESDVNYSIRQFHGKKLVLPKNDKYWPGIDKFQWHLSNKLIK